MSTPITISTTGSLAPDFEHIDDESVDNKCPACYASTKLHSYKEDKGGETAAHIISDTPNIVDMGYSDIDLRVCIHDTSLTSAETNF
jgi:hypothetical protein